MLIFALADLFLRLSLMFYRQSIRCSPLCGDGLRGVWRLWAGRGVVDRTLKSAEQNRILWKTSQAVIDRTESGLQESEKHRYFVTNPR